MDNLYMKHNYTPHKKLGNAFYCSVIFLIWGMVENALSLSLSYAAGDENYISCAHQWSGFHMPYVLSTYRGGQARTKGQKMT